MRVGDSTLMMLVLFRAGLMFIILLSMKVRLVGMDQLELRVRQVRLLQGLGNMSFGVQLQVVQQAYSSGLLEQKMQIALQILVLY